MSDTMAQRSDRDRNLLVRRESSIMTKTKEAHDVSEKERGGNAMFLKERENTNGKAGPKKGKVI